MGRTPNDDRSDSKNPNNDAYWSSDANQEQQTGGADEDEPEYIASQTRPMSNQIPVPHAAAPQIVPDHDLKRPGVIGKALSPLPSLYLKCLLENKLRERTIKVDTVNIEAARNEAQALWDEGGFVFMALYNKHALVMEKSQLGDISHDLATELAALGELQELIETAESHRHSARKGLAVVDSIRDKQSFYRSVQTFGTWAAATTALRTELAEKIVSLQARRYPITEASVAVSAEVGKRYLKTKACLRWIGDFQSGKIKLDPMYDAFDKAEPIMAILR